MMPTFQQMQRMTPKRRLRVCRMIEVGNLIQLATILLGLLYIFWQLATP